MKKKALVAVAGLFRLYQAIYLTYLYPDYAWDMVVLRYGEDVQTIESVKAISEASGRFRKIYTSNAVTQFEGKMSLLCEYVKMVIYFMLGKRKCYARSVLLQSIDDFKYDMLCVACSYSIIEGAMLCFAGEVETIIMEEGFDDYVCSKKNRGVFWLVGAKLLYRMQYINLLADNDYKPLRFCKKYVRIPDRIRKNTFLEVNKMFDFNMVNRERFESTISNAFHIAEDQFDVVIYTAPLWSYDLERYYFGFEQYIASMYEGKRVLLKRHPQDNYKYFFKNVEVMEAYADVPGELILRHYKDAEHVFTFPSTILLDPEVQTICYNLIMFSEGCKEYCVAFKRAVDFLKSDSKKIINL